MGSRDPALDSQAQALIDDIEDGISPPSTTLSIERSRELLDDLFTDENPVAVGDILNTEIQGPNGPIPLRLYAPEKTGPHPVLVFFHGGGWIRGSLGAYDGLCRKIANRSSYLVVSVDYRLAPEDPFPAGFEDCYVATEWAAENATELGGDPDWIAIGGDSAGGNLAAAVALAARDWDGKALDHQLLIYPALNSPTLRWFDSYDENGTGYLLEMDSVEWYLDHYVDDPDLGNKYAFPLQARTVSGLPPATILTAGFDPLVDEGKAYADRLDDAGIETTEIEYESQIHGFLSLYEFIDAGEEAIGEVAGNIQEAYTQTQESSS